MSDLTKELERLADGIDAPGDEQVFSPVRKEATGNLRNVGQMSPLKLMKVYAEMKPFKKIDPEGWKWIDDEVKARKADGRL